MNEKTIGMITALALRPNSPHGARTMILARLSTPSSIIRTLAGGVLAAHIAFAHGAQDEVLPTIPGIVATNTRLEFIRDGFNGTEGPVALEDGSLIFTETRGSRITRIGTDGTISTFLENANGSNGLGFNPRGELISVQTVKPQVGVIYPADKVRVLADQFAGKPLWRPNDLVVDRKGGVYFTDPGPGGASEQSNNFKPAVYYIKPSGETLRIAEDIERPNGIQLSPDEKTLYIANTNGEFVLAYDIAADGSISGRRNLARLAGWQKGENGLFASGADGLAIDEQGRLYVASNSGIEIFSSKGDAVGIIPLPVKPQNLAFAGSGKKILYVVGRGAAYRLAVLTPGYKGRAK